MPKILIDVHSHEILKSVKSEMKGEGISATFSDAIRRLDETKHERFVEDEVFLL